MRSIGVAVAIPYGYCQCGCGQRTTIATRNDSRAGAVKGQPRRFVHHHHPVPSHCPKGHPLSGDNVYVTPEGWRQCRTCRRAARTESARRTQQVAVYRSRFPEKYRAHQAVGNALETGRLVKPDACEKCGADAHLHGHHDDYNKPLDVRWLCPRCHSAHHREAA